MKLFKYIAFFLLLFLRFTAKADTAVVMFDDGDVFDQIGLVDQPIVGNQNAFSEHERVQLSPEKVKKKRLKYRSGCCEFYIVELPDTQVRTSKFKYTHYVYPEDKIYTKEPLRYQLRGPPII